MNILRDNLDIKINVINCICDNLLEDVNRLKENRESKAREDISYKEDTYNEAIGLVSYIDALKDLAKSIDLHREGYIDCLVDNYENDIRELEPDIIEQSNIQDDIYDGLDYTCYPIDIEENKPEDIPF